MSAWIGARIATLLVIGACVGALWAALRQPRTAQRPSPPLRSERAAPPAGATPCAVPGAGDRESSAALRRAQEALAELVALQEQLDEDWAAQPPDLAERDALVLAEGVLRNLSHNMPSQPPVVLTECTPSLCSSVYRVPEDASVVSMLGHAREALGDD